LLYRVITVLPFAEHLRTSLIDRPEYDEYLESEHEQQINIVSLIHWW